MLLNIWIILSIDLFCYSQIFHSHFVSFLFLDGAGAVSPFLGVPGVQWGLGAGPLVSAHQVFPAPVITLPLKEPELSMKGFYWLIWQVSQSVFMETEKFSDVAGQSMNLHCFTKITLLVSCLKCISEVLHSLFKVILQITLHTSTIQSIFHKQQHQNVWICWSELS